MKTSQLAGVLENIFSGSNENSISENRDSTTRFLHEYVHSANGVSASELLILAFHVLQVLFVKINTVVIMYKFCKVATRALTRSSIQSLISSRSEPSSIIETQNVGVTPATASELVVMPAQSSVNSTSGEKNSALTIVVESSPPVNDPSLAHFFIPNSAVLSLPFPSEKLIVQIIRTSGRYVVESTYTKVRDICMTMIWKIDDTVVIRRCLGILTEVLSPSYSFKLKIFYLFSTCCALDSCDCSFHAMSWWRHSVDVR
jgi:hypothetical protein